MPTSSGCMFRSPPSSTTSAALEVCLWGQGWLSCPALPSPAPDWSDWDPPRAPRLYSCLVLVKVGALCSASCRGRSDHTRPGELQGTPRSCSPDELCQLPGLHQAVGQVGVLLPAVLGMQLEREGEQRGWDSQADTCPAPRLPANPPKPLWTVPANTSVCISPPPRRAWDALTPQHNQVVGPCSLP